MYYAIFTQTMEGVEVRFPDAPSAITFGKDLDEAYEMAVDVLSAILAAGKKGQDYLTPHVLEDLQKGMKEGELIFPVRPDSKIMESYSPKERVSVMLDKALLSEIDKARANPKVDRSKWLANAAHYFLGQQKAT